MSKLLSSINGNALYAQKAAADADGNSFSQYAKTTSLTAYQAAGSYMTSNALDNLSGTWQTVTAKQDALSDEQISNIDNAVTSTAGLATTSWVTSQGYVTGIDVSDLQKTADMTSYMKSTALDSLSGTWNSVTGKQDALSDAQMSNINNAVTSTAGLATTSWVTSQKYQKTADMTAYQAAGNYMTADALTGKSGAWDNCVTTVSNNSAAWSEGGGGGGGGTTYTASTPYYLTVDNTNSAIGLTDYATQSIEMVQGSVELIVDNDTITAVDGVGALSIAVNTENVATRSWVNSQGFQKTADMTAYQAAGDYMTADALTGKSGTWDDCATTVSNNSASWAAGALPSVTTDETLYGYVGGSAVYQKLYYTVVPKINGGSSARVLIGAVPACQMCWIDNANSFVIYSSHTTSHDLSRVVPVNFEMPQSSWTDAAVQKTIAGSTGLTWLATTGGNLSSIFSMSNGSSARYTANIVVKYVK